MLSIKFDNSALQLQIHTWYFKTNTIRFSVYWQNVLNEDFMLIVKANTVVETDHSILCQPERLGCINPQ